MLFDRGDEVTVQAGEEGMRFLLVSGKPLEEPVAWYGPIVMNTQEQLRQAFEELRERDVPEALSHMRSIHGARHSGAGNGFDQYATSLAIFPSRIEKMNTAW